MSPPTQLFFPRRLQRLAYFIRVCLCNAVGALIFVLGSPFEQPLGALSYLVLAIYAVLFVLLPRLRDIEMSAWWLLLVLVPVANVLLSILLLFRAPVYRFQQIHADATAKA